MNERSHHDRTGATFGPHATDFGKLVFDDRCRRCWHAAGVAETEAKYAKLVEAAQYVQPLMHQQCVRDGWRNLHHPVCSLLKQALAELGVK